MSLLSRLMHLLLCLALVAGGPGVAAASAARAMQSTLDTPADASCHEDMADAGAAAPTDGHPYAPGGCECCDDGACPCPGAASFACGLAPRPAIGLQTPADAPSLAAGAARGPPRLGNALRPPIG